MTQNAVERFYRHIVPWFEKSRRAPDYLTTNLQQGYIRGFARLDAKLRSSGFARVNHLHMFCVAPDCPGTRIRRITGTFWMPSSLV